MATGLETGGHLARRTSSALEHCSAYPFFAFGGCSGGIYKGTKGYYGYQGYQGVLRGAKGNMGEQALTGARSGTIRC